jgi:hypothetical protein
MLRSALISLAAIAALLVLPHRGQAEPLASSDEGFFLTAPLTALVDLLAEPFRPAAPQPAEPSIFGLGRLGAEPLLLPALPASRPYFRSGWRNGMDFGLAAITWNRAELAKRDLAQPTMLSTRRPWTQLDMPALGLSAYFRF